MPDKTKEDISSIHDAPELSSILKLCRHLVDKAYPLDGGYRVPKRELDRLRNKMWRMQNHD